MMMELEFRAWDGEKMHQNVSIVHGVAIKHGYHGTAWTVEAKAGIPMQFTGLFDKSGKKIFKGDVVSAPFASGMGGKSTRYKMFSATVEYGNGSYFIKPHGDIFTGDYRWFPGFNECEIIGNIYQGEIEEQ